MIKLEKYNNVFTGFLTNVLGTLSMFLVTIFLTRTVDQAIYGEFRLAFSFVSLMVVLLLMGRDNGVIYYSQKCEHNDKKRRVTSEESFFSLIVLLVGVFFLFVFREQVVSNFFNNNISLENYSISLMMIPLWGWFNMGIASLKVEKLVNYSFTLTNFTQRLIRIPFFVILVYIDSSFTSLALSMIFSQAILLVLMIKKVPWIKAFKVAKLKFFFKRFKYAVQLGLASIVFVVLSKVDIIMVGKYGSDIKQVAIYDVCVMLSMVVVFPYTALVKASEPVISNILKEKEKFKEYTLNLNLAVTMASIIVLMFAINSDLILSFFGSEYLIGKQPLFILSIGFLLVSFLASPIEFLNMGGYVRISLKILILCLLLNVILNFFLIPEYGLNGASFATMISLVTTKFIALYLVRKKMKIRLLKFSDFKFLLPFFISGLIYFIISIKTTDHLFFNIGVSFLILIFYICLVYLFNKRVSTYILQVVKSKVY